MSAADHLRLFPDTADPLLRFKAEAEQREQELAAERKREAREERRSKAREVTLLRAEIECLRSELAAVRDECERRRIEGLEVTAEKITELADRIFNHITGRFAALESQIEKARASVVEAAYGRQPRKDFRFANEKSAEGDGEPLDLPPLSKARALN
jgi:hypothetical protein